MIPVLEDNIGRNIDTVRQRIATAARKSGRSADDITLVAVTKTVGPEKIMEAVSYGLTEFGENRVQELTQKYDILANMCNWHLIGHLQTNKVKYIIDKVKLIHSLDSFRLADEIQKQAFKAGRVVDVLVQINISGEESKFGIAPQHVEEFLREIACKPNIKVKGLMTIAPLVENPEEVRCYFKEMKKIFIDIKRKSIDNICMDYLSMGMSNDFEVAIQEGSNMVRIGSAIFGKRQ